MEAFSGSSYLVYNEDGSFKCSCREDGKLILNKVPAYLGHLNPDNSFKYAFEKYSYDENGNCTRYTKFDTGGNVEYFTDYKYDEKGNKIQEIKYKSNGKNTYVISFDDSVMSKEVTPVWVIFFTIFLAPYLKINPIRMCHIVT